MKTINQNEQYISTSTVAKLLGYSVGTIQKLVDSGAFRSYVTRGKHRRILREDVIEYGRNVLKKDMNEPPQTLKNLSIVFVGQRPLSEACYQALKELDVDWQCINSPLGLLDLGTHAHHLFWDGMDSWASFVLLADKQISRHKHLVFNARHFSPEQRNKIQGFAQIFEQDLNAGLLQGYILGCNIQ